MNTEQQLQLRMECLRLAEEIVNPKVPSDQTLDRILLTARRLYEFIMADQKEETAA